MNFIPIEATDNKPSSDNWKSLPSWAFTQSFYYKDLTNGGPMLKCSPSKANLVSSKIYSDGGVDYHIPVLDIDINCWLTESTTPGHHHLVINKVMPAEDYEKLLKTLVEVGIVQQGIMDLQWNPEGMTAIRLPGIKKKPEEKSSGLMGESQKPISFVSDFNDGGVLKKYEKTSSEYLNQPPSTDEKPSSHENSTREFEKLWKLARPFGKVSPFSEVLDGYTEYLKMKKKWDEPDFGMNKAKAPSDAAPPDNLPF